MTRSKTDKITDINNFRSKRRFQKLADEYVSNLPASSNTYSNIVFLYDEDLAVCGRELLFKRLNKLATDNRQVLIVTDVGFGRDGFYVNFDELGSGKDDGSGYDECIESWDKKR